MSTKQNTIELLDNIKNLVEEHGMSDSICNLLNNIDITLEVIKDKKVSSSLDIKTYVGVGTAKYGMTRDKIHKCFGQDYKSFVKFKGKEPVDSYASEGIFIYYKKGGLCEAIEMFSPSDPVFKSQHLLKKTFKECTTYLKRLDSELTIDADGFTSLKLGIGGYCPSPKDDSKIESIICFEKNYYNK